MDKMTSGQIRIAEMAVTLVETRIRERRDSCTYCEQGPNAYRQSERAVRHAFKDVRRIFRKIRREIDKEGGGS